MKNFFLEFFLVFSGVYLLIAVAMIFTDLIAKGGTDSANLPTVKKN